MERERSQYYARAIGNALLVSAGVIAIVGLFALWRLGTEVEDRFGFGSDDGPRFDDYVTVLFGYTTGWITAMGIVGGFGLYFRWLAVEQDAKRAEFDMLLDALGVPVEDEAGDQPEETTPDA
jgi:hypothetical protein